MKARPALVAACLAASAVALAIAPVTPAATPAAPASPPPAAAYALAGPPANLIANPTLDESAADGSTAAGFTATGGVHYGYLGDPRRDLASRGFWLDSGQPAGEVACTVGGLDPAAGRWFRFTFRGLPQRGFAVGDDDLYAKVAFFGPGGVSYDAKVKPIYDQVESARRDLGVNGVRRQNGAEAWHTYQMDFVLPFPQVDAVRLSVGFGHGAGKAADAGKASDAAFLVDDWSLARLPEPPGGTTPAATRPAAVVPAGPLLPLGGRWFYAARAGEAMPPAAFDGSNADRLLYKDDGYSAPFAGNTSAWLRAGSLNADGSAATADRLIADNVTVTFDATAMVVRTHGVPNHPTGRFPEVGRGNPNAIQDRPATYYIPLVPKDNPDRRATDDRNANGALHMGPIGLAVNGVVFFNPFDAGSQDATDLMDRCCGHPAPNNVYHYHKYPICVNSPWADEGAAHSPLLGWAFDGYPLYGPYETAGVMAKDVKGAAGTVGDAAAPGGPLDAFNMHYDPQRGWHYHATPGQFPYLIGGFRGVEDPRDARRGGGGGRRGMGGPGGPGGRGGPPSGRPGEGGGPPPGVGSGEQ
jgi:hypothetical protein